MADNKASQAINSEQWTSIQGIEAGVRESLPWLGDRVAAVFQRQFDDTALSRIGEALMVLTGDLSGFSSELSELYVKTEDFGRLLEQTLIRIGNERIDEKRNLYRLFLADAIASPCDPFDQQIRFLQTVQELRRDQLRILRTLGSPSAPGSSGAKTAMQIIQAKIPDIQYDRLEGLLSQMNDIGLIRMEDFRVARVGGGNRIADCLTPAGKHILKLLKRLE